MENIALRDYEVEYRLFDGILSDQFGLASLVGIDLDEDGGLSMRSIEEDEVVDELEASV